MNEAPECMLCEENVKLKLPHVLKCVLIHSCELKTPKQQVLLTEGALETYMCIVIVLLLVMVLLQGWD